MTEVRYFRQLKDTPQHFRGAIVKGGLAGYRVISDEWDTPSKKAALREPQCNDTPTNHHTIEDNPEWYEEVFEKRFFYTRKDKSRLQSDKPKVGDSKGNL